MILFPNPASGEAALRFVLNLEGELRVEVYDASGRLIYDELHSGLPPAEHQINIPLEGWQSGIYLVRACMGSQALVKQLVVQ